MYQKIKRVCAIAAVFALAGCGLVESVGPDVDTLSRAGAEAKNTNLLINIMRASRREPMYFSTLAVLRGSNSLTGGLSASGSASTSSYEAADSWSRVLGFSISPSGSFTSSPSFDLAPLDSQGFLQSLLTPVLPNVFNFFATQGVPREILLYMMISKVVLTVDGKKIEFVNDVYSPSFPDFVKELQFGVAHGLTTETVTDTVPVGPPLPASQLTALLPSLDKLIAAGVLPTPTPKGELQLQMSKPIVRFCFDPALAKEPIEGSMNDQICSRAQKETTKQPDSSSNTFSFSVNSNGPAIGIELYTRSVADMFNFLGDIVAAENYDPGNTSERAPAVRGIKLITPEAQTIGSAKPISDMFVVTKGSSTDSLVSVEFNGANYSISRNSRTSSLVLSLLNQLVSLSTSIQDIPSSNTVVSVGH
jgi:hypothetical protein